jgi:hypothetical protein
MGRISKSFTLILAAILAVSSLMIVESASAQAIPKPSVPQFSIKYFDNSYDVPPTYGIDQYTGKTVIIKEGSHVDNKVVEFTIKNQPFTPQFYPSFSTNTSLFYNIEVKGHYTNTWTEVYSSSTFTYTPGWNNNNVYTWYDYPVQSNSENSVLSLLANYPNGSKIDFRVQAIIANVTQIWLPNFLPDYGMRYHGPSDFTQKMAWTSAYPSDWSNIQTISIPDGSLTVSTSASLTPSPTLTLTVTPTPTVPEFPILAILPFFVSMFLVVVYFKHRRTTHESY